MSQSRNNIATPFSSLMARDQKCILLLKTILTWCRPVTSFQHRMGLFQRERERISIVHDREREVLSLQRDPYKVYLETLKKFIFWLSLPKWENDWKEARADCATIFFCLIQFPSRERERENMKMTDFIFLFFSLRKQIKIRPWITPTSQLKGSSVCKCNRKHR